MGIVDNSSANEYVAYNYNGVYTSNVFHDMAEVSGKDTIRIQDSAHLIIASQDASSPVSDLDIILEGDISGGVTYHAWGYADISVRVDGEEVVYIIGGRDVAPGIELKLNHDNSAGSITTLQSDLAAMTSADYTSFWGVTPTWYTGVRDFFGVELTDWWDPLVIDLDNDGIGTDHDQSLDRYFDLNEDGFAELVAWNNGDDGFLVRDLNANGRIDNGGELFGDGMTDGFSALGVYDSNSDNVIDSNDAIWSELEIWQDKNSDGQTQSDELLSLASLDINGINLVSSEVQGQPYSHISTVTTTSGTLAAGNFVFEVSETNAQYVADFNLALPALFMPNLRGYNSLPELRIAMSLDNSGTGNLLSLVQDIASYDLTSLFEDWNTVADKIEDLLFRWAGVDGVSPTSRGPHLDDARQLAFIEEYFGEAFVDRNFGNGNPGEVQANGIEEIWRETLLPRFTGHILIQGVGSQLFDEQAGYAFDTDRIEGSFSLSTNTIDSLEAYATALGTTAEREEFWSGVTEFLNGAFTAYPSGGFGIITSNSTDKAALDLAINNSDASLNLDHFIDKLLNPLGDVITGDATVETINGSSDADMISGFGGDDVIWGGDGNDIIYGHNEDGSGDDNADDVIYGQDGDDIIFGGGGNDRLIGGDGSDHLIGGAGDDILQDRSGESSSTQNLLEGGLGNDTIVIAPGGTDRDLFASDDDGTDYIEFASASNPYKFLLEDLEIMRFLNNGIFIEGDGKSGSQDVSFDIFLIDQLDELTDNDGIGFEFLRLNTSYNQVEDVPYWFDLKDYLSNITGSLKTIGTDNNDEISGITFGSFEDEIFGGAGHDTISGGAADDILFGEGGDDTLSGGDGNDIIEGGSGNDVIEGGAGNDTINVGTGANTANGGDGDDAITVSASETAAQNFSGGTGNDTIKLSRYSSHTIDGGIGTDTIDLSSISSGIIRTDLSQQRADKDNDGVYEDTIIAIENVYGSFARDEIYGDSGSNVLNGYNDSDFLYGLGGDDILIGGNHNDEIDGGSGSDTVDYSESPNAVVANLASSGWVYDAVNGVQANKAEDGWGDTDTLISIENIIGSSDSDYFRGNSDSNTIEAGAGDDTLIGGAGDDTLDGGDGTDTVSYASSTGGVTVNLHNGVATDGHDDTDTLISIENVIGSDYDDDIIGANLVNNELHGGLGDDVIRGYIGTDTLYGDEGNDELLGYGGEDILHGGAGNDIMSGGSDSDTFYGGTGDDVITDDINSFVDGGTDLDGSDFDWLRLYHSSEGAKINLQTGTISTLSDVIVGSVANLERITATDFNDELVGDLNDNDLRGHYGDDLIYGHDGEDRLFGSDGNDTLYGGNDNDTLNGNDGNDVLHGGDGADYLWGHAGNDTLNGDAGGDVLTGGDDDDTLNGGDDGDVMFGDGNSLDESTYSFDGGSDTLYGHGGNDYMYGGKGDDFLYGDDQADVLYGGSDDDYLEGRGGDDTLYGDGSSAYSYSGNDELNGGAGADNLYGENGDDILWTGEGADKLRGGAGADTFAVYDVSGGNDMGFVYDFSESDGDMIDLSALLSGYDPMTDAITDFVQIAQGANTTFQVDRDGSGSTHGWENVIRLVGNTTLSTDEAALETSGLLITA